MSVHLNPLYWSAVQRQPFKKAFLELPSEEPEDAEDRRAELGIRVVSRGAHEAMPAPLETFEELGVLPTYVLQSLEESGILSPMPVQAQALPVVLSGCDLVGIAPTGSGKTLAFLLPAVVHVEGQPLQPAGRVATPAVLVLAPTRELAVQIHTEAGKMLRYSQRGCHRRGISTAVIYGGGQKRDQLRELSRSPQIIVATPGRLIDFLGLHTSEAVVTLEQVTYFVLDEADRMLDLGFEDDVSKLASQIRPERQMLFFSATWAMEVQELAQELCHQSAKPVRIAVDQRRVGTRHTREGITQEVVVVDYHGDHKRQEQEKRKLLKAHLRGLLSKSEDNKALVFVREKQFADQLAEKMVDAGFLAASMHGGKPQDVRLETLEQFRRGKLKLLVATDVIGRGIDIPSVSHVVIFEMGPIDDYIHRIGRTARGKDGKGHALVFFEYWHRDPHVASQLIEVLQNAKQVVPEELRRIATEVARGQRDDIPEIFVDASEKPKPPSNFELEQRLGGAFRRLNFKKVGAPSVPAATRGTTRTDSGPGVVAAGVAEVGTPCRSACSDKGAESLGEDAPDKAHQDDQNGPVWKKFHTGDCRGCWWWCEDHGEWFLEEEPGYWQKYSDPASGRHYWWRDDATWFWIR